MARTNSTLPHQRSELFITDGGLETSMIFLEGYELPCFAAFDLLKESQGYEALRKYYTRYLEIAAAFGTGFILESPTWRANPDWLTRTGYPESSLTEVNKRSIEMLQALKAEYTGRVNDIVISGCIGPRGDGYKPGALMTVTEAEDYHMKQIAVFADSDVDLLSAITMNYVEEAIGIANAAAQVNHPAVISFTLETDGRLATGMSLREAIETTDREAKEEPAYYMINCVHPSHFVGEIEKDKDNAWTTRIRGIRANASCKSHAELDESTELDSGDPEMLATENQHIKELFPHLNVFGGCCGTDDRHIREMVKALVAAPV
jgi:S-methylmethionine-dependent homocysteine/selenocysteine methylase